MKRGEWIRQEVCVLGGEFRPGFQRAEVGQESEQKPVQIRERGSQAKSVFTDQ